MTIQPSIHSTLGYWLYIQIILNVNSMCFGVFKQMLTSIICKLNPQHVFNLFDEKHYTWENHQFIPVG